MYQRTISEIVAIHRMEPEIRDLFVEGNCDCHLLTWYLREIGKTTVSVTRIDLVEIPDDIVVKHGLNLDSNRAKVLSLAYELHEYGITVITAGCIVDLDFQPFIPLERVVPLIHFTDYNSIECYLLSERNLSKFIDLVLKGFSLNSVRIIDAISYIAVEIFSIRLTNEYLRWGLPWVNLKGYVKCKKSKITFNKNGYIKAYLSKGRKLHEKEAFLSRLAESQSIISGKSIMVSFRGHDFTYLLYKLISKTKKDHNLANHDALEAALAGCIDLDSLRSEPLFSYIYEF